MFKIALTTISVQIAIIISISVVPLSFDSKYNVFCMYLDCLLCAVVRSSCLLFLINFYFLVTLSQLRSAHFNTHTRKATNPYTPSSFLAALHRGIFRIFPRSVFPFIFAINWARNYFFSYFGGCLHRGLIPYTCIYPSFSVLDAHLCKFV